MVETSLRRLSERLGYHFHDTGLLKQALTHRSVGDTNNERLEFLGDAVLSVVIADYLFREYPEASEGELTRLRASLVKGSTLAEVARHLEIGHCLILGGGEMKSGGHRRSSTLSDALEAIVGAIFLESGLDVCRERIIDWFGMLLDSPLDAGNKDAKTRLQEHLQGRGMALPLYEVVATEGDPHNQVFTVACQVPGIGEPARGKASSRKKAEKMAAELALKILQDKSDE
jgi:ribonuclease-3